MVARATQAVAYYESQIIPGETSMSRISRRTLLQQAAFSAAGLSLARGAVTHTASGALTLAQGGHSKYTIVLAPDASPSEQRAANELQNFIAEMTGAKLPISSDAASAGEYAILLGQSAALTKLQPRMDFASLGREGYVLKTAGNTLIIAGSRERGTMYGVYGLLEKLGCRWFTAEVSRIPKSQTLRVGPLDETAKPAFEYREPFFHEAELMDWAARNRMNGEHTQLDASTGGKFQYYPFVHTFRKLVPPEIYFKDHPEYFSLIDGKRRDTENRSQLCLTNPDVLRIAVQTVLGWMKDHPEASIYSVSQNDGTGWCECDNCSRVEQEEGGVHSGPLLRFVNALAVEVEKQHPEKLIDTLAYWYTEDPPSKARPYKTVRIRLCPIGACEAHPYEECEYNQYFMKNLRAWSNITQQLYIWHYNTNFSNYLLPLPDFDQLAVDLPMYSRHGVVGIFLEGSPSGGGGAENAELRSYIMAKLLWDTKTNVRQAIDEFHLAYFGEAAKPMRAYFDLQHRQVRKAPRGDGYHAWIYDRADAPYLNDAFLAQATALFAQAEKAAVTPLAKKNVRKAKLPLDYVHLTRTKVFRVTDGKYQPVDLAALKQKWATLVAEAKSFGITDLREPNSLAIDEKEFAARMKPYDVVTMENEHLRVDVVPELQARAVRMIDKRSGKDLLLRPNSGATTYPDLGGLTVGAQSDYVNAPGWKIEWTLGNHSASEIHFTGKSENGMALERVLRVEGTQLKTSTTLKNTSATAAPALLQTHVDAEGGDLKKAEVRFTSMAAASVRLALIQPNTQPSGGVNYADNDRPNGEWGVGKIAGMPILMNRFAKEQVARCQLSWSAKSENRVGFSLQTFKQTLQPGESLTLESDYSAV